MQPGERESTGTEAGKPPLDHYDSSTPLAQEFARGFQSPDGLQLVVEVAHDLRSPLTAILFLAEAMQRAQSGPVNELQQKQLGIIYTAALGLITLASDIIELSQGGEELPEKDRVQFSVKQILASIADVARPMSEEKEVPIRLISTGADLRIGFPVAISRVLLNLTTNALKFTRSGYVVIAAATTSGDRMRFSVTDTGQGISPEELERLYELFRPHRTRKTTTLYGSGIGLTICRRLVQAMGSELQLQTAPGQGTCFFFELELPIVTSEIAPAPMPVAGTPH